MSQPEKFDDKKTEYWRKEVEEIKKDSTHGSIYLADRVLDIIENFIKKQLKRRPKLCDSD